MKPSSKATAGRRGLAALALVAAVLVAYIPAIQGGFVWDDDYNVTDNTALRDLGGLRRIWLEVTVPPYYPLYHSALWLGYRLWGPEPGPYHLVNVLLHALNALLAWRILGRLGVRGAWVVAAIFALHPVHVESVAWITELKNVLSTTFYLAALRAYLAWSGLDDESPGRRRAARFYVLALVLFAAALLTKTVTVTLPVAILVIAWWKRGRVEVRDVVPTLPLFAAGLVFGLITVWMEKFVVGASGLSWSYSLLERCLIAGRALWFYASKLVWPFPVVFVYPLWRIDSAAPWAYVYPLSAAAVVIGLWLARQRIGRGPLAGTLYFVLTLSPALGLFDVYYMRNSLVADRWQYLASLGLIAVLVAASVSVLDRLPKAYGMLVGAVSTGLLLSVLASATWSEARHYENAETLWRATLEKNPGSFTAHNNLGSLLLARGQTAEAEGHFRLALDARSEFPEAHNNLGIVMHRRGRVDEAMRHYEQAIRIRPDYADAHNNLGISIATVGGVEDALPQFREAVRLRPDFVNAHRNLGTALLHVGDLEGAGRHFEQVTRLVPDDAGSRVSLALTRVRQGRARDAIRLYREARRIAPDSRDAALGLAWILATHPDDTLRDGGEAARLAEAHLDAPGRNDPTTLDVLAAAYAEQGRFEDARTAAARAAGRARILGQQQLAAEIDGRVRGYTRGQPFRATAPPHGRVSR